MLRVGLVEQVIDRVGREIAAGRWRPGDRLPSVADLAVELDVGRSTVREAVQALAHRGALSVQQGRGTFVVDGGDPGSDDGEEGWSRWLARSEVLDVYEARRGLEVDAARWAALRRTDEDLEVLETAAAARRDARSAGVVSEWAAADLALHRAVFAATHNPVLVRLFEALGTAMSEAFAQQSDDSGSTVDTADDHDRLVAAIVVGEPEAATAATEAYLDACQADLRRLLGTRR